MESEAPKTPARPGVDDESTAVMKYDGDDDEQFADDPEDDGVSPGSLFLSKLPDISWQNEAPLRPEASDASPASTTDRKKQSFAPSEDMPREAAESSVQAKHVLVKAARSVQVSATSQSTTVSQANVQHEQGEVPEGKTQSRKTIAFETRTSSMMGDIHLNSSSQLTPSLVKNNKRCLVAPSRKEFRANPIAGVETIAEAMNTNSTAVRNAPFLAERPTTAALSDGLARAGAQHVAPSLLNHPKPLVVNPQSRPPYAQMPPRKRPVITTEHHQREPSAALASVPPAVSLTTKSPQSASSASTVSPSKGKKREPKPKKTTKVKPSSDQKKVRAARISSVETIPISSVETQVCKAARLVGQELEHGDWPEVSPGARQVAAAAIEEFSRTIFLPHILQQVANRRTSPPSNERVFLATLLMLREVLAQNAERIFDMEPVPRQPGEEELNDNDAAPGHKRRKQQCEEEERQFMAQLYGTGVVVSTVQGIPEADVFLPRLTEIMDSYVCGDETFASVMNRLSGQHRGVMPNGSLLKSEENVAWKVSYNRVRDLHPLLKRSRRRVEHRQADDTSNGIDVPSPNAVLVSMVEKQTQE